MASLWVHCNGFTAKGSPLRPFLSGIFRIKLETSLLPKLTNHIPFWTRHVYDTICFVKVGSVNYILSVLNSFDVNIRCTYELEHEGNLPFLHVLYCRTGKKIYTTVYRKVTNNGVYFNWNAIASNNWKRVKPKTLERAYLICLTDELRNREVKHIERVFYENNSYPPNSVKPRIAFTGRNVGRSFQIVYYNECAEEQCNENYIKQEKGSVAMLGETQNIIFINIV